MEEQLLEKILLNLGEDTPLILVVFIFARMVWPGMQELAEKYLQARTTAAPATSFVPGVVTIVLDESVREVVSGLSAIVGAMTAAGVASATAKASPPSSAGGKGTTSGVGAARSSDDETVKGIRRD